MTLATRHVLRRIGVVATLDRRPRKTLRWKTSSVAFNELFVSPQRGRVTKPL